MRTILVANPKGGVGKSTIATNLAAYLAVTGGQVALGDIDRQQSSSHWLKMRPATAAAIRVWDVTADSWSKPPKVVGHGVLDSPAGLHGKKLALFIKEVDQVIVPLQPSPFDIAATRDFLDLLLEEKAVRSSKTFVAVVGNRVDPRTHAAHRLEAFLAEYHLPVLTYLRDTQLYIQAAADGLSLFDLPPPRVTKDRAQWQPILDWVTEEQPS